MDNKDPSMDIDNLDENVERQDFGNDLLDNGRIGR